MTIMTLLVPLLTCLLLAFSTRSNAKLSPDSMWLRMTPLNSNSSLLYDYLSHLRGGVVVVASNDFLNDDDSVIQLKTAAEELGTSLSTMLGVHIPVTCCGSTLTTTTTTTTLTVRVGDQVPPVSVDVEGYSLTPNQILARTPSGALYGAYRYLSFLQRRLSLPGSPPSGPVVSNPAMTHRVWDLWDGLTGDVTRGFAGDSIIWPYALWKNSVGPPPTQLFVATCDDNDEFQRWSGTMLASGGVASSLMNQGNKECVTSKLPGGVQVDQHCGDETYWYNETSLQISVGTAKTKDKTCLDINHALGPDLDYYHCHPVGERDYQNQQFMIEKVVTTTAITTPVYRLKSVSDTGTCMTLRNSYPPSPNTPDDVTFQQRWALLLRLLKSSGVNAITINDVNACGLNTNLLSPSTLLNVSTNLGPALTKYAITPYFSACFAAPTILDNVTSNPKDPASLQWWSDKVDEIYKSFSMFGGFLVKADSEGNLGPQSFNCTEAEGANMLASALDRHNGTLMWRAFVYGNHETPIGREELVKQAYDTFLPLDGKFQNNVIVQIKNGPMDFQIREPLHPLLGGLSKTNVMMEVQCAQEYTGQQIHAVNLITMWSEYLKFDTKHAINGTNETTIEALLTNGKMVVERSERSTLSSLRRRKASGMACVSNVGTYANWTGHVLAGSNTYGFGRLAWDPTASSRDINEEWTRMTFPVDDATAQHGETAGTAAAGTAAAGAGAGAAHSSSDAVDVVDVVVDMLERSRGIYEGYTSPLGIGFMVFGGYAGQGPCAPMTTGPGSGPYGMTCPASPGRRRRLDRRAGLDHYWVDPCSNYYFQNSSHDGLGCSRIAKSLGGTGYSHQYHPDNAAIFDDIHQCPQELLLWFHHVEWTEWPHLVLRNGTKCTLIDYIRVTHNEALEDVAGMLEDWKSLKSLMDYERWSGVLGRFEQQVNDANVMGEKIVSFYESLQKGG